MARTDQPTTHSTIVQLHLDAIATVEALRTVHLGGLQQVCVERLQQAVRAVHVDEVTFVAVPTAWWFLEGSVVLERLLDEGVIVLPSREQRHEQAQ